MQSTPLRRTVGQHRTDERPRRRSGRTGRDHSYGSGSWHERWQQTV